MVIPRNLYPGGFSALLSRGRAYGKGNQKYFIFKKLEFDIFFIYYIFFLIFLNYFCQEKCFAPSDAKIFFF